MTIRKNIISAASRLAAIVIAFAALLAASGCTQNDGRIGDIFGTWRLDSITPADGGDAERVTDLAWQFQSSVVCMKRVLGHGEHYEYWGRWQMDNGVLTLFYDNSDSTTEPGTPPYSLPAGYHFPKAPAVLNFSVVRLDGSHMELSYVDDQSATYHYQFTKIP